MNGLLQTLRNLGLVRVGALALVAALSVGFFGFITQRIATPGYGLLYGGLDAKDSGEMVQKLDAMNIPYQVKSDGGVDHGADRPGRAPAHAAGE